LNPTLRDAILAEANLQETEKETERMQGEKETQQQKKHQMIK